MAVRDSRTEGLRVQIYRQMSPQQRMWIAAQLYEDSISIIRSAILDRNPNLPPDALKRQIRRRLLPKSLFQKVEAALAERNSHGAT
ncbi:MAG: hypothetical protein U0350_07535 [Caldilineaceae bacterium]